MIACEVCNDKNFCNPRCGQWEYCYGKFGEPVETFTEERRTNLIRTYIPPYGYRIITEKEREDIEWIQLMKSLKSNKS